MTDQPTTPAEANDGMLPARACSPIAIWRTDDPPNGWKGTIITSAGDIIGDARWTPENGFHRVHVQYSTPLSRNSDTALVWWQPLDADQWADWENEKSLSVGATEKANETLH